MEQALAIEGLKTRVIELENVIEKLKVSRDLDSTTSSKPLSGDILILTDRITSRINCMNKITSR
jgi:transposase